MALFASPSAVSAFARAFSLTDSPATDHAPICALRALCIGESTAERARTFGMTVHTAQEASMTALYRLAEELTLELVL
jgi:uroporphyrinogen-III synthase